MPIALPTDVVITPQMVRGLSSEQIDRLYEEIEEGADPRPTLTLKEFMVQAWPILEPRTPFVDGWHIDAICEHLTACSDGLILDLLINIPPRMSKSLLVSVMWFCWTWSYLPETRWMYSCYHEPLALRDSIKCRTLLQSPWYRANWGTRFRLKPDQNAKSRFENDHTGFRLATGVGGGQTGEGGDFVVGDDIHNVTQAESEMVRVNTVNWWCETMSTRTNDAKRGVHALVMQRVHERDITGEVIARELGYETLIIPMRYEDTEEARARVTCLGWRDPRTEDGELLCAGRMDEKALEKREKILGPWATAGQHQQRPAPRGGGMFRREWFGEPLTELPKTQTVPGKHGAEEVKISYRYVRYWDKAGVASGKRYGDWTVGTLMARSDDGIFYVVDVVRGQWEAKERNGIILNTARADQARFGRVTIYVEQEPGLAKESTDYILRLLAGFNVRAYRSNKDKEGRVEPLQAQAAARNVKLIRGQWIRAWLDELEVYPNGSNDDQGDSAGGAFNCLSTSGKNVIERRKMGVSTRFA